VQWLRNAGEEDTFYGTHRTGTETDRHEEEEEDTDMRLKDEAVHDDDTHTRTRIHSGRFNEITRLAWWLFFFL